MNTYKTLIHVCLVSSLCFLNNLSLIAQCPSNIDVATTIPSGSTCTYSGNQTQGISILNYVTLTIPATSTLIINGNYTVYDNLIIYGRVEVYGTMILRSNAIVVVHEGSSLYVRDDYYNGSPISVLLDEHTYVYGDMEVGGTYHNNSGSETFVRDNGTLTFDNYDDNGGYLEVQEGQEGCENTGCCGAGCSLLPIKLLSFDVRDLNGNAQLIWITAQEINNEYFEIYKSTLYSEEYDLIGRISGAGNSTNTLTYSYIDYDFAETSRYRIKQVDYDGKSEIFEAKMLRKHEWTAPLSIFPNPTSGYINLKGPDYNQYIITDETGKIISAASKIDMTEIESNINSALKNRRGVFLIRLKNAETESTVRLIKQ